MTRNRALAAGYRRRLHRGVGTFGVTIALLTVACSGSGGDEGVSTTVGAGPSTTAPMTTTPATTAPVTTEARVATTQGTSTTVADSDVPPGAIRVAPGDDLSTTVATAPRDAVFVLEAGLHRMQTAVPQQGQTFLGADGAVMSGAMILDGFVADGERWRIDGIAKTGGEHGECAEGYDGCRFDQDLFVDDEMLWQVTSIDELAPGRWYWEGDTIFLADDPTGHRIELSVLPHAFISSADDVTIRRLAIEKYATPAQEGAVSAQEAKEGPAGAGWIIEDIEVRGAHGAAVRTGQGTIVRDSYLHSNGQLGITVAGGVDVVIEGNEISNNNLAGFRWGWEAGGAKFTETVGLTVRGNYAHDNLGPGLWTDINAYDTLYEDNAVSNNAGPGIFHEISFDAVIRNNTVTGNGYGKPEWLWGAGILVAASRDVIVTDNRLAGNADGIAGIQQDRGLGPEGEYVLDNMSVTRNEISMEEGHTGVVTDTGDPEVFDRNLVFGENTYPAVSGERFAWDNRLMNRLGWLTVGQGVGSVWQ